METALKWIITYLLVFILVFIGGFVEIVFSKSDRGIRYFIVGAIAAIGAIHVLFAIWL